MAEILTVAEREAARRQAYRAIRTTLRKRRPVPGDFLDADAPWWERAVASVLHGARFSIVVIALAAGLASAIRNVAAVYDNYHAAGTSPPVAVLASLAFVASVEAALFVVALARHGIQMRRRAANAPRRVASLADLWRGLRVRLGLAAPLPYAELPERDGLGVVLAMAFAFAVTANLAVALAPALAETHEPLQVFLAGLAARPAAEQVQLALDLALALLPPALALVGGELTARFAAEYAADAEAGRAAYAAALDAWRAAWNDPLGTEEGQAYLGDLLEEKRARKATRKRRGSEPMAQPVDGGNHRPPVQIVS